MAKLFLLLGGNLGDKAKIFGDARYLLEEQVGTIIQKSAVYETEPWGFESDDLFWNQVLILNTELDALDVLKNTKYIENKIGRIRKIDQYISRLIDIDLLFYDDLVLQSEELEIPHPRMIDRRFVLVPLLEVAAQKKHPVFEKTVEEMLVACADQLGVTRLNSI